jgi:type IV pilus assembly protein PilM
LVLGLDWGGGSSLKYVLLRRTTVGLKLQVETFGQIVLSVDTPEAILDISQALHELFLRERQIKKSKIVIGLGTEKVVLKKESYPPLSSKELKQTIFFGIQKDLGKEGEEGGVVCDHLPLGPDHAVEGNSEYLCFGSETLSVSEKAGVIASEGVIPVKIAPNILALKNLVDLLPKAKASDTICFLDIGAVRSVLVFFKNGFVDFYREIVIGGDDFTKAITGTIFHEGRAIQFTNKEALEFKFRHGYPLGFSEGMTFRGAPLTEVGAMMRPVVERMTGEIHRSIGFYKDKSGGSQVNSLYLIGGGAQLRHLSQVLTERLDIPTFLFTPPQNLRVAGGAKQDQHFKSKFLEYGTAFALALETNAAGNLLPPQFQKLHQLAVIKRYCSWAAFFIFILIAGFTAIDRMGVKNLKSQKVTQEQRANMVGAKVARYEKNQRLKADIEGRVIKIDAKIQQDPQYVLLLKMISNTLPKNLSLVSVKIGEDQSAESKKGAESKSRSAKPGEGGGKKAEKTILIEGESKLSIPDIRISVAQFMLELSKSGYLTDVKLQNEKVIEATDEYIFDVEGKLNF